LIRGGGASILDSTMRAPLQCRHWVFVLTSSLAAAALGGCDGSGAKGGTGGGSGATGGNATGGDGTGGRGGGAGSGGFTTTGGAGGIANTGGIGTGGSSTGGNAASGGSNGGGSNGGGSTGTGGSAGSGGMAGTAGHGNGGGGNGGGGNGVPNTCPPSTPLTGGKKYCSNTTGTVAGGYAYELWQQGTGTGCMTVYGTDATFGATWTNADDYLARIGLGFDKTRTPTQIGTLSAEFAETKTASDGLVYVGIYGWTIDPLREYYIIEDWGSTMPGGLASDGTPRDKVGTITVDGETYDVWKKTRVNKPAITGDNKTFDQYFSIRRTARQCGHVSISTHFSQWTGLGLQLGKLEEAKILVEAQDSSGSIEFTKATVTLGK